MAFDISNTSGLITVQYGPKIVDMIQDEFPLVSDEVFAFEKKQKIGSSYKFPVVLSHSHGFTDNSDGSVFSLNSPVSASVAEALVSATSQVLREFVSYAALTRIKGGVKKYDPELTNLIERLAKSMAHRQEIKVLYGQAPLGSTSEVAASGTTGSFTVTAATWASGIWNGAEGASVDIFATTGSAAPTNTNAAVVISSIDRATRVVSFTCASGDAAALDALTTAVVYWRGIKTGASSFIEYQGLDAMVSASTIHGISTSTYSLWKPESFAVGGNLTLSKLHQGLSLVAGKGGMGSMTLLLSPLTWTYLASEMDALARYNDPAADSRKNGPKLIGYHTQTGVVKVMPHNKVKQGEAFAFMEGDFSRIGSFDIGIGTPTIDGGRLALRDLDAQGGAELRFFTDQALKAARAGMLVKFTGITNS